MERVGEEGERQMRGSGWRGVGGEEGIVEKDLPDRVLIDL